MEYWNDNTIKVEYDPQNNKQSLELHAVGAQTYITLEEKDYADTDNNTIYCNTSSGNDTTGDGTKALPYKTYLKSGNSATVLKTKAIILNSGLVSEDLSTLSNPFFEGFYADTGITAKITTRTLDYVPSDSNTIFFAKSGSDGNAGTQAAPKLTIAGARAARDASHQKIMCIDNGVYTEAGFEFTGDMKALYAQIGCAPTWKITSNTSSVVLNDLVVTSESQWHTQSLDCLVACRLISNKIAIAYRDVDDSNKIKASIYNESMGQIVDEWTIHSGAVGFKTIAIAALANGNWVIVWYNSTSQYYMLAIYDADGVEVKAPASISATFTKVGTVPMGVCQLLNTDIVVVYTLQNGTTDYGKYMIFDTDGGQKLSATAITAANERTNQLAVTALDNGGFAVSYANSTDNVNEFCIFNSSGMRTVSDQVYDNTTAGYYSYIYNQTGFNQFIVTSHHGTGLDTYFSIYDYNGNQIKGLTAVTGVGEGSIMPQIAVLDNGEILIGYKDGSDSERYKYVVYDNAGNLIVSKQTYSANGLGSSWIEPSPVVLLSNGNILFLWLDTSWVGKYAVYHPYHFYALKISTASVINGWQLESDSNYIQRLIHQNSAGLTLRNCTLINAQTHNINKIGYAINGDGALDAQYNVIYDCDAGIYNENDISTIKYNAIFRCRQGYAVYVKGTAAKNGDITISHNTLYSNKGGIQLEDNGGANEIIKDNILCDNSEYDGTAETLCSMTHSVYNADLHNITAGDGCQKINPLFKNDGTFDPDDTDLNLKKIILIDIADSPAAGAASDGTDCGCYAVTEIGARESWTCFTVSKTPGCIVSDVDPAQNSKNISIDGSVNADAGGWTEYLELDFPGVLASELENWKLLLACNSRRVRLYLDPATWPNEYEEYTFIPGKTRLSPKHYRLANTGSQDLKLTFARCWQ